MSKRRAANVADRAAILRCVVCRVLGAEEEKTERPNQPLITGDNKINK